MIESAAGQSAITIVITAVKAAAFFSIRKTPPTIFLDSLRLDYDPPAIASQWGLICARRLLMKLVEVANR